MWFLWETWWSPSQQQVSSVSKCTHMILKMTDSINLITSHVLASLNIYNANRNWDNSLAGKRLLGRPRHRCEEYIKMGLKEVVWCYMHSIHLTGHDPVTGCCKTVMNFRFRSVDRRSDTRLPKKDSVLLGFIYKSVENVSWRGGGVVVKLAALWTSSLGGGYER